MNVIGNSEAARKLGNDVVKSTKNIFEMTNDIKAQLGALSGSLRDEGYNEYEQLVMEIYKSIDAHVEDVSSLRQAMNAYAEILERK